MTVQPYHSERRIIRQIALNAHALQAFAVTGLVAGSSYLDAMRNDLLISSSLATLRGCIEALMLVRPPDAPLPPAGPKRPEYYPKTADEISAYLLEESAEVLKVIGKAVRFGLDSSNPDLPPERRETNAAALLRETRDLEVAGRIFMGERP